jgi:hypothetical protein
MEPSIRSINEKRTDAEEKLKDLIALRIKCRRQPEDILVMGYSGAYSLKYKDIIPIVEMEMSWARAQVELYEDKAVEAYARKHVR